MGSKRVPKRIINAEGVRNALDRHLGRYHSALEAILAENVAWKLHGTCMERAWTCMDVTSQEGSAAPRGGPSEGRGSIPKGIWLP